MIFFKKRTKSCKYERADFNLLYDRIFVHGSLSYSGSIAEPESHSFMLEELVDARYRGLSHVLCIDLGLPEALPCVDRREDEGLTQQVNTIVRTWLCIRVSDIYCVQNLVIGMETEQAIFLPILRGLSTLSLPVQWRALRESSWFPPLGTAITRVLSNTVQCAPGACFRAYVQSVTSCQDSYEVVSSHSFKCLQHFNKGFLALFVAVVYRHVST